MTARSKTGMLYRSGSLYRLSSKDTAKLRELGIKTVVNFLTPSEIENQGGDKLPVGVHSVYLPIEGLGNEVDDLIVARKTGDFSKIPSDFNYGIHGILPETGKDSYSRLFEVLSDEDNYPLFFIVPMAFTGPGPRLLWSCPLSGFPGKRLARTTCFLTRIAYRRVKGALRCWIL